MNNQNIYTYIDSSTIHRVAARSCPGGGGQLRQAPAQCGQVAAFPRAEMVIDGELYPLVMTIVTNLAIENGDL